MTQSIEMQDDSAGQGQTGAWEIAGVSGGDADQLKFISFAIGEDQYGVDIMSVREIKGWSDVANLPKQPDYVRGVLNLRGVIVPIVDLRMRFGQGQTAATASHIVMIVQIGQRLVGLLADRVLDIVSIDGSKIQPVPKISRSARVDFLSGLVTVDSSLIALIDLSNLLAQDEGADLVQTSPIN
jgi:purine-binding chemotaxis protein CheW